MTNPTEKSRPGIDAVVYALQEKGDVDFQTVGLTMEPGGYVKHLVLVHLTNFCPDSQEKPFQERETGGEEGEEEESRSFNLKTQGANGARVPASHPCRGAREGGGEQEDGHWEGSGVAGGGGVASEEGKWRECGGRESHPDVFEESMVQEFAGLWEDSD